MSIITDKVAHLTDEQIRNGVIDIAKEMDEDQLRTCIFDLVTWITDRESLEQVLLAAETE